jgi:hypothetical protein
MNEDAYRLIVEDGIAAIYREYAEGKIDREGAVKRLADFFVSKGEPDALINAAGTVNRWSR